jgi:cytochrome b561
MLSRSGFILGVATIVATPWVFWTGLAIDMQPDRQTLITAIWHHIGISMLFLPLCIIYLLVRLFTAQNKLAQGYQKVAEKLVFWALFAMLTSGFLTVWARGSAVKVFDWIVIPSPVERMQTAYSILEYSHGLISQLSKIVVLMWLASHVYTWAQHKRHQ